jgi:cellulose synthase/poly-beta-1,6-N-acetylglucosamine synthase-like glycosyltransferase
LTDPVTLLAALIFLGSCYTLAVIYGGSRKMRTLATVRPEKLPNPPLVSIIVPACNEEATLEAGLRSLLAQDYPAIEIIVIDDRSTDNTFQVMEQIAARNERLKTMQIHTLPPGWLGKNHALYRGAQQARGEILLFTDADVILTPDTVSRAVTVLYQEQADHLCLVFRNLTRGPLLNAMVVDALGGLFLLLRPWKVQEENRKNIKNKYFIGIGAFNMITARAYRQIGTHAVLKMHPIDDVMLGKKVKEQGLHQQCLLGGNFVTVPWYETLGDMVSGLMKNVFAMYDYRITYAAAGISAITLMTILPPWGVVGCTGAARLLFGGALACRLLVFSRNARLLKAGPATLPFCLLTPYIIVFIILRSVYVTIRDQGITWRSTHYPLAALRREPPLLDLPWQRKRKASKT